MDVFARAYPVDIANNPRRVPVHLSEVLGSTTLARLYCFDDLTWLDDSGASSSTGPCLTHWQCSTPIANEATTSVIGACTDVSVTRQEAGGGLSHRR
jgi:hypothetical protein